MEEEAIEALAQQEGSIIDLIQVEEGQKSIGGIQSMQQLMSTGNEDVQEDPDTASFKSSDDGGLPLWRS